MALQKISQLNSITGAQITASSDVLAVVNNNETKKITVSGLHSGSFSGSFQGDGSGITGVTGEWDGSHNGNASITGSLTVTSDISSSGNLYGDKLYTQAIKSLVGPVVQISDNLDVVGHITASGNISASGYYYGDGSQLTGVTSEWDGTLNGDAEITGSLILSGSNIDLNVLGNITASGDISASGKFIGKIDAPDTNYSNNHYPILAITDPIEPSYLLPFTSNGFSFNPGTDTLTVGAGGINTTGAVTSSIYRGEQLYINSGSALSYPNIPTADAAFIIMSASADFSITSAVTPNNLFLFTEYPGDGGGLASSTLLFQVNHGVGGGKNSMAQIACVASTLTPSHAADLVFSTREVGGNVVERMRMTQSKTRITGSLYVTGNIETPGLVNKSGGTFRIQHPLITGSTLYHSFIEGPKCDLIYRGTSTLTSGTSNINIDSVSNMTEGTFVALTQDPQLFLQNTTGWEPLKGNISENVLSIECKSTSSVDTVSWMVVAERADDFIKDWNLTDDDGHLIPEWPTGSSN